MNKETKNTTSGSMEDAIERINNATTWTECRDNHLGVVPQDLRDLLKPEQNEQLQNFTALILEWLPMQKRMGIEGAVRNGLLQMERIPNTNRSFVSEKPRDTLLGWITGEPQIRIRDFFL